MDSFARGQNKKLMKSPRAKGDKDKDVGGEIKLVNGFKNKKN